MTKGVIYNREKMLKNISKNLGRDMSDDALARPKWKHEPQWKVFSGYTQNQLVEVLKEQCSKIYTDFIETSGGELPHVVDQVVSNYGGGPIITWEDPRFEEYGMGHLMKDEWPEKNINVNMWDPLIGRKNIELAEKANIGVTFSDQTLAESGTVVLYSDKGKGRAVSLLPTTYIAIIPKSTLVPRITQVAHSIHQSIEKGESIASCINFITGPSNSADIEMNLVVGVHGPVKATYILVNDR